MVKRSLLQAIGAALLLASLFVFADAQHDYRPNLMTEIVLPACAVLFVASLVINLAKNLKKSPSSTKEIL